MFIVPRSRSHMFLTFVSPPKDQDADVTGPNSSVYGEDESKMQNLI